MSEPVPSAASSGPSPAVTDAGVAAGRGVVFIGGAKLYFLFAGAALEFTLPNLVSSAVYGAYGLVAQAVSVFNNVVVQGTIQAVSRQTTQDPARADAAKATGLKMQLRLGVPLALAFAAMAPLVAYLLHDPAKAGPLALAAAIIAGYSIYAVLVGSANGTRQFHRQAGLDVLFSTMKTVLVLGAAAAGLGVFGAILGWVAAVGFILLVASAWVRWPRAKAEPVAPMLAFMAGVAAYLVLINLIMSADSFALKRLSTEWFRLHPVAVVQDIAAHFGIEAKPSLFADAEVGRYRTVQQLARLPYQLMVAVTFVVFPLVSQATFENDRAKAAGYVRTTMRYSLIFAGMMGAALASNPGALMGVPFRAEYAAVGGPALAALAIGHVAFALFSIGGSILNGAGKTREAVIGAAVTLAVLVVALFVSLPRATPGREMLAVAGACTGGAMVIGALVTGWLLYQHFGEFVPIATGLRVALATAAAIGVGSVWPLPGKLFVLVGAGAAAAAYLAVLILTGELGRADLERVLAVARRRRAK
jgi:stage V sporulation protein B